MKMTLKHISLLTLGMVAVAMLTSVRLTPVQTSAQKTLSLKSIPQMLVADGQETHGDKGTPPKGKG
jgi:hypothetical protein